MRKKYPSERKASESERFRPRAPEEHQIAREKRKIAKRRPQNTVYYILRHRVVRASS